MFRVMTKKEYWDWLDQGLAPEQTNVSDSLKFLPVRARNFLAGIELRLSSRAEFTLKTAQDMYVLSRLGDLKGARVLEAGGGNSRVLRVLAENNECWLVDKFEGKGSGPKDMPRIPGVKFTLDYMGTFNPDIPDNYFDTVISISVMEHIPLEKLEDFFIDCARVLKPGGTMIHAIDTYVFDELDQGSADSGFWADRLEAYLELAARTRSGMRFLEEPQMGRSPLFSCRYASLSDNVMYGWQKNSPSRKREIGQLVTILAEWVKEGPQ